MFDIIISFFINFIRINIINFFYLKEKNLIIEK